MTPGEQQRPGRALFGVDRSIVRSGDGLSLVVNTRVVLLCVVAVVLAVVLLVVSITTGDYPIDLATTWDVVTGRHAGFENTVVLGWRVPRAVAGLVFGAALGVSGAIFQSVTRNPLGSPDIIGFNVGAYSGVLLSIWFVGENLAGSFGAALVGGTATALVVYLLAWRRGIAGFRFVIVGIAVTAMLTSLNTLILVKADTRVAMHASVWGQGSLENVRWDSLLPALTMLIVLLPLALVLGPRLRTMELGDETARALGVRVDRATLALLAVGVGLTALVTAVAGPISFIALAAPQIARRLARSSGTNMFASAAVGSVLLLVADLVASKLLGANALPVGIVTVVLGGGYLVWLLIQEMKR